MIGGTYKEIELMPHKIKSEEKDDNGRDDG